MPASNRDAAEPSPYGSAAVAYLDAGWLSPLPVPPRSKRIAIVGWTGRHGTTPSRADVEAWREDQPHANLALRLPGDILGIDVDAYGDKVGAATLHECERQWGPLPRTWRSTSRDDGISGIRLFAIPPGLDWPGQLPGGGVETIHSAHRYLIAPPSLHPDGGRVYRWIDPDGLDTLSIPSPADQARLPIGWIEHLARGLYVEESVSLEMPRSEIASWLAAVPHTKDALCPLMARYVLSATTSMVAASSRHETLLTSLLQLVRFGESGHTGLAHAIREVRQAFIDAVRLDKSRSESEANSEAERALAGAVAKVAASPSDPGTGDPCTVMADTFAKARTAAKAAPERIVTPVPEAPPAPRSPLALLLLAAERDGPDPRVVEAEPEKESVERTSWWPADMDLALSGKFAEGPPTVLARADGQFLFYAHRINGLVGPSESGKSWVALEACRQVLAAGYRVLILDFEDSPAGIVGRLVSMSIEPDVLRARLAYVGPSEPLAPVQMADLMTALAVIGPDDLIVLDGFNAAMTLQGLDLMSNKDVTVFYQQLLRVLVLTRACIVYVDHTPKNDAEGDSRGGIGAQAKRAMTTGAILRCDIKTPFGRNQVGYIAILADKDRSGHVRAVSPGRKVGTAKLDSVTDDQGVNRVSLVIEMAEPASVGESAGGTEYFRPTALMRRVSDHLTVYPEGLSRSQIVEGVTGKASGVRKAIDALVIEGYLTSVTTGQAQIHSLVRPYFPELDPLLSEENPDPVPPRPTPSRDGAEQPRPPVPNPPSRGDGRDGVQRGSGPESSRATPSPRPEELMLGDSGDDV